MVGGAACIVRELVSFLVFDADSKQSGIETSFDSRIC
jgi:hypothetical protein